jgi:ABC-type multidrug transport system fused ATPase/permease subunit
MPPKSWPSEGAITFDKLYLRYSKGEGNVLKNLTFTVEAKQKVCELISLTIQTVGCLAIFLLCFSVLFLIKTNFYCSGF